MDILLVGHRGSGKTTLGGLVAPRLDLELVDLDQRITEATGLSPAQLIADSEPHFRQLERQHLEGLIEEPTRTDRLIVLGAGCESIPPGPLCAWIWRDGWEEAARDERARLRPEVDFDEEVAWMRQTREPRWAAAAHLRLDISRGRSVERAARMLTSYLDWARQARRSPLAGRTWLVVGRDKTIARATADVRLFGLAGLEVRSDLMETRSAEEIDDVPVLASLRDDDPAWLRSWEPAAAFDVDLAFLDGVLAADVLGELDPRPLLLSTHPDALDFGDAEALAAAAERVAEAHPAWATKIMLKYAPPIDDPFALNDALDVDAWLRRTGRPVTFLPQGERVAWIRPTLALGDSMNEPNATNYLPVGLAPRRVAEVDSDAPPTPMDLQDWLPHMAGRRPEDYDGLLGDPVWTSVGDWWHRQAALDAGEALGYAKIPLGRDTDAMTVQHTLGLLHDLGLRGLSVTSPMKKRVVQCCVQPDVDEPREALNTLRRTTEGWEGTDTDAVGMRATLGAVEAAGIGPGTVAVIGRGGVAPAVRQAIAESGWTLVHHASARAGWTDEAPEAVGLVINAAGDFDNAYVDPPACRAWVDLHYHGVRPPPAGVELHLNGDIFFEAQAAAQRRFWQGAGLS